MPRRRPTSAAPARRFPPEDAQRQPGMPPPTSRWRRRAMLPKDGKSSKAKAPGTPVPAAAAPKTHHLPALTTAGGHDKRKTSVTSISLPAGPRSVAPPQPPPKRDASAPKAPSKPSTQDDSQGSDISEGGGAGQGGGGGSGGGASGGGGGASGGPRRRRRRRRRQRGRKREHRHTRRRQRRHRHEQQRLRPTCAARRRRERNGRLAALRLPRRPPPTPSLLPRAQVEGRCCPPTTRLPHASL